METGNVSAKKAIDRERTSWKRAKEAGRVPRFARRSRIQDIYKNCPRGCIVTHCIPLNHHKVSGLHTPDNLLYRTDTKTVRTKVRMGYIWNRKIREELQAISAPTTTSSE